jgi:glycosyltransferase involved in cell wall biosynthesis
MSNFNITVIIPVLNRPKNVETFINSFVKNTDTSRADLLFVTSASCQEEIQEINKFTGNITVAIAPDDVISWGKRINWGINYSNTHHHFSTPAPWILCCADDVVFHPNWFEEAEKASVNFDGIIGTNDLGHPATIGGWHTTHPIVSRNYVMTQGTMDEVGKFCHEEYFHNYVDVEMVHTAMKRGAWKHVPQCIIEHIHPAWNKALWDDVYEKGQEKMPLDRDLWTLRKQKFGL